MIERFLKQTKFTSVEDYNKNLKFIIPENFNFLQLCLRRDGRMGRGGTREVGHSVD